MRVLLDTCVALWLAVEPEKLSERAAHLIREGNTECILCSISIWEISAKHGLGKLELPEPPSILIPKLRRDFDLTPLDFDDASAVLGGSLPNFHRDPFDRMLVSLASVNGLPILTPDPQIAAYPVRTLWS